MTRKNRPGPYIQRKYNSGYCHSCNTHWEVSHCAHGSVFPEQLDDRCFEGHMLYHKTKKPIRSKLRVGLGVLYGPSPTHTCFRSQKALPWCGQSHASEGHQEQRSGPQPHLGSGVPGSYVEKIHNDVTSKCVLQTHAKIILQMNFHQVRGEGRGHSKFIGHPVAFMKPWLAPNQYLPLTDLCKVRVEPEEHGGMCVKWSLQFILPSGEQRRLLIQQALHFGFRAPRLLPGTLPSPRAQVASFRSCLC